MIPKYSLKGVTIKAMTIATIINTKKNDRIIFRFLTIILLQTQNPTSKYYVKNKLNTNNIPAAIGANALS